MSSDGRVCPHPLHWFHVFEIVSNRHPAGQTAVSVPLILGVWHYASDHEKRERFHEHLYLASKYGALAEIDEYLRSRKDEEWYFEGSRGLSKRVHLPC